MSSAAKKRKRKRKSQAPVALVYVVTVLIFMALISMLAVYLLKSFGLLKEDEELLQAVLEGSIDLKPRMEFLAPLDPMLWDKAMIQADLEMKHIEEKQRASYSTVLSLMEISL